MITYLDGKPVFDAGQNLADALAAAGRAARGRMIVEATADGAPIPNEHLETPPSSEPYAGELHFTSAETAEVIADAAGAACRSLDRIDDLLARAAHDTQVGQTQSAMEALTQMLSEWEGVQQAAGLILMSTPEGQPGAPSFDDAISSLVATLSAVQAALAEQDWAQLADALEDDLAQVARTWRTLLSTLDTPPREQAA